MRDTVTDEALLDLIASHDERALEVLHQRYYQRLCGFALSIVKTVPLTEEVVSDVFLQLWLKRSELTVRTKLKSYLFTAVRNQAINILRKERDAHEDIDSISPSQTPLANSVASSLEYKELQQEIDQLINTLPEQRQIIFRLNRFDGLRYKEIAEVLSISPSTVQNQMVAAVKQLAEQYPKMSARWESALTWLLLFG
ncbi:MAG: RNA polymerase sigma factor [Cyclobacteriaceae bacterium]